MKVIKIGGNVIDDPAALDRFEKDFARMEGEKVLIHGGGKIATRLSAQLGIETRMIDGRRVTDQATLDVVTMVYAGLINKRIVASLQSFGCRAIGMCGADANAITSHKRISKDGVDYGFVGDVDRVDARILCDLTKVGLSPVLCAITHDGQGGLLNTNADTVAGETAAALGRLTDTELVFCFEKQGVLRLPDKDDSVIEHIDSAVYQQLKEEKVITGGMLPKLENAFKVLRAGVRKVIIASPEFLSDPRCKHTEVVL